jgi:hypothetical protein
MMVAAIRILVFCIGMASVGAAGCGAPDMDRFAKATRIDIMLSPSTAEYPAPVAAQIARLEPSRRGTCSDPDNIRIIAEQLKHWQWAWMSPWVASDKQPAATLIFHDPQQWLGTLDVYPHALGYGRNMRRRISADEAAELLQYAINCAQMSAPVIVR